MASQIATLAYGGLMVASIPPLFLFINSSRLLLKYEDMTKKAAKISSEAGRQLQKTRTTQGSAVFASALSIVSAAYSLFFTDISGGLPVANAIVLYAATNHVSGFWKGAMKAPPGVGGSEYNDAVRATEQGLSWLNALGMAWGVVCVGRFVQVGLAFLSR